MDEGEAKRRRHADKPKASTKHPYAATEHRVIDSEAYADLTFSARSLLVLITRQLSRDNNGQLQATFSYMNKYGFSENTLSRAIGELIAHGLIYRTRSGGYQQGAAQYCVTWLPIKRKEGLFLNGYQPEGWKRWTPEGKKTRPPNLRETHLKNGKWTASATPIFEGGGPPKTEDTELIPCSPAKSAGALSISWHGARPRTSNWIPGYLDSLKACGLEGEQCFEIPPRVLQ